jgi:hypothetical protein
MQVTSSPIPSSEAGKSGCNKIYESATPAEIIDRRDRERVLFLPDVPVLLPDACHASSRRKGSTLRRGILAGCKATYELDPNGPCRLVEKNGVLDEEKGMMGVRQRGRT